MTRETKIGLLVGLAFIIVIGILLSDHLTNSTDPPQAALGGAGNGVRQAVGSPGNGNPSAPVTVVTPVVTPQQTVATQSELTPPAPAVQIVKVGGPETTASQSISSSTPQAASQVGTPSAPAADAGDAAKAKPDDVSAAASNTANTPLITPVPAAPVPTDSDLSKVAEAHGETIVPVDGTKPAAGSAQAYVAQPGDSLSKIAAKFFGSGTKSNRDLIVRANPSLAANEDMVIAGKTYQIPAAKAAAKVKTAIAAADTSSSNDAGNVAGTAIDDSTAKTASATEDKPSKAAADAGYVYTVQPGDNLTRIARDEVGDVHAVAAIQELNPDRLKGPNHDIVIAGSKIRLPGKPLARAE